MGRAQEREKKKKKFCWKNGNRSRGFFYTLGITLQSFTSAGSLGSHTCEKGLAFFLHRQQQLFESHKNVSDTEYRRVYFIPFPGISKLSTTLPPFQVVVVVASSMWKNIQVNYGATTPRVAIFHCYYYSLKALHICYRRKEQQQQGKCFLSRSFIAVVQQSQEYISGFLRRRTTNAILLLPRLSLSPAAATESKRPAIKQRPTSLPIQDLLLNRVGYNMSKPSTTTQQKKRRSPPSPQKDLDFLLPFLAKKIVSWSVKLISSLWDSIEKPLKKKLERRRKREDYTARRKKVIVLSEGIRQRRRNPQGLFVESTIQTVCVRK